MDQTLNDDYTSCRAYGRARQTHDAELCEVGPGTPCGEFMRRYWHPVWVSSKLGAAAEASHPWRRPDHFSQRPRPGLLSPRCAHRGTTLYYGKVDENGIRCCYHGWQFDVQGRCIDQPCEPQGGQHKANIRQPWYPLEERYGLVFAYLGPADRQPVLPRWDILENLAPDEKIYPSSTSGFKAGPDHPLEILPCNWLQDFENIMDPFHVPILHVTHSGRSAIFSPTFALMPDVSFEYTELGVLYRAHRRLDDGNVLDRVSVGMYPNVQSVPDGGSLKPGRSNHMIWRVPIDDTHVCHFSALRVPLNYQGRQRPGEEKLWAEMSEEEHQSAPMDYEAQVGQGPIALASEEHLATSDKGIVMLRRRLREQIDIVRNGGDPIGVCFDAARAICKVEAGNFYQKSATTLERSNS